VGVRAVAAVTTAAAVVVGVGAAAAWLGPSSGWFAFVVVWWPMVCVGTSSRFVRLRLPERWHQLRDVERDGRIYERAGVRIAKTVLRRGPLSWFNPDLHLPCERTPDELAHLAQRMRDAEASHAVLFVAMLPVALHAVARGWWLSALLVVLFDVAMNAYPVMLQRYNRARLAQRFDLSSV
jgi:hypothetical protein